MKATELGRLFEGLSRADCRKLLERMNLRERHALRTHWHVWAHDGQFAPEQDWQTWLILAGRGFGKTRAGAEWVREIAENDPQARIALVAASLHEARAVMVEGESGLRAIAPHGKRPRFEPSKRTLTWHNGAQAMIYSAGEPESLRGPQHSHACRPGPERRPRQRGAEPNRRVASPCDRRHAGRPARAKGNAGSSAAAPRAAGAARQARSPASAAATGCSPPRATESWRLTGPADRSSTIAAAGSWRPGLLHPAGVPRSIRRPAPH